MNLLSIAGFTNVGYRLHARNHDEIDADLTGKTVVITGGTGGLGRAAATRIAALGARTVVVGRDPEKLDAISRETAGGVVGYEADLSSMSEIRDLAKRLLDAEGRLHVLVNNVGVLLPERTETTEGLEKTLAVDLAGQFLLTNLLIPRLVESAPSRIINVTSGGMYSERLRPDDLHFAQGKYTGTAAYARAKRGQVVLTGMWADRLKGTGVSVHAMHPGWAKTAGVSESLPTFNRLMKPLLRTPDEGADTIVWLAASPDPGGTSGFLWFDRERVDEHLFDRTRETAEERDQFWAALVDLTDSELPERFG